MRDTKFFFIKHDGFVSGYFLVMFLYVSTLITAVSINLSYRAKTLQNLQEIVHDQSKELEAVYRIKQALQYQKLDRISCRYDERYIYAEIDGNLLIVEYDIEKKILIDYEVIKNNE